MEFKERKCRLRKIAILLLLISASASATIFVPIDSTVVREIELSTHFQSRISVKGGRITQVVHPGCDIEINLDDEIGQVFVYPLTNYPQSTSLTVITDEGDVQDFQISFIDKPAEIIILESSETCENEDFFEGEYIGSGHPDYMVMVVQGILSGRVPEGFISCNTDPVCRNIKKGIRVHLVSKLVSPDETVYIWRIENTSRKTQKILERELNFQGGKWVYLNTNTLNKKRHATAIVGVKN